MAASYLRAAADTHVFTRETTSDRLKQVKTAPEVLDVAIQFEKDSVHFFVAMKEMLPDEKGMSKVDGLIKGQLDRVRMLAEARKTCLPTRYGIIS